MEEFLEENSYLDLEEHGWTQGDSEMIMDCDMEFEMLEPTVAEVDSPKEQDPTKKWPN